jgi:hypothetical protein
MCSGSMPTMSQLSDFPGIAVIACPKADLIAVSFSSGTAAFVFTLINGIVIPPKKYCILSIPCIRKICNN